MWCSKTPLCLCCAAWIEEEKERQTSAKFGSRDGNANLKIKCIKKNRATLLSNTQPSRKHAPPLTAPTRQNSLTRPSTSTSLLCAHPQQRAAPAPTTTTAPAQVVRPVVVVVEVGARGAEAGVRVVTNAIVREMIKEGDDVLQEHGKHWAAGLDGWR